jgi:6-pyruvoyl-tetrahydropterin synthase
MRLFVENLTNVDFSYLCPSRGLVGETWFANVELIGDLDHQGMVCDFGTVKKTLRNWLDREIDHRLLVPALSSRVCHQTNNGQVEIELELDSGLRLFTRSPEQAVTLVAAEKITPSSVAMDCMKHLGELFDGEIQQILLTFTEENIDGPFYHYSHGLKKHLGNCQRIAHGHRSKILIWRDQKLCMNTMNEWAKRWNDIYIASTEDCTHQNASEASFAYTSAQGEYQLTLPVAQCYFIDSDTTVEHIAQHLANEISLRHPGEKITVKAFEGAAKGAIAEAWVEAR